MHTHALGQNHTMHTTTLTPCDLDLDFRPLSTGELRCLLATLVSRWYDPTPRIEPGTRYRRRALYHCTSQAGET